MAYPEKGATYRNKPAWMDRAVAGEKRAQGGSTPTAPKPPLTPESNQRRNAAKLCAYELRF